MADFLAGIRGVLENYTSVFEDCAIAIAVGCVEFPKRAGRRNAAAIRLDCGASVLSADPKEKTNGNQTNRNSAIK